MKVRGPKSGFRKTIPLRRSLRRDTTPAEKLFWSKVAQKQFLNLKFRRQHGIGNYVVDFYCPEKKLIIEIDGDTHAVGTGAELDKERTFYLETLGYKVVRYANRAVMFNVEGVFQDLVRRLNLL